MGEHSELIERLKAATEGSRQLDAEVFCAAHGHALVGWSNDWAPGGFIYVRPSGARVFSSGEDHAAFTTSLDAIVGLIERNGWRLNSVDASVRLRTSVGLKSVEERHVDIPDENRSAWMYDYAGGAAKTLPLALCIALLSALQQGGAEQ